MSLTYGFYNSVNGDRKYDAIQMSSIFDGIIGDGVYETIGDALMVKVSEGMGITVGTGRAWFDHTWTLNDALIPLTVGTAEVLTDRYDTVVLEVDSASRVNSIKIIKGTGAENPTKPELTNNDSLHQHPLAHIRVRAGAQSIVQTDIENCVGTSACPFVIGVVKVMNIDNFISTWSLQWQDWLNQQNGIMADWMSQSKSDFETWFNQLKVQLDENVAANLENQILELQDTLNQILSGGAIQQTIQDNTGDNILDSAGNAIQGSIYYTA